MKISVSPKNFFTVFIHFPGRGRKETKFGKIPVTIKGKARPKPIVVKIRNMELVSEVKAKVRAVPKKGALQGVDRIVASTPLKKSPKKLSSVWIFPNFFPPGVENSKSPNILSEKIKRTIVITAIKPGD